MNRCQRDPVAVRYTLPRFGNPLEIPAKSESAEIQKWKVQGEVRWTTAGWLLSWYEIAGSDMELVYKCILSVKNSV